jgi:hypothetical protein
VLRLAFAIAALTAIAIPKTALADFFSTSPGPLTQAHSSLDNKDKCQECHVGTRELSNDKCLACHKPINERQLDKKGLHATPKAMGKPCQLCHTEHKGRGKDIMGFAAFGGRDKFDHSITGFVLDGKHAETKCNQCHTQKTASGTQTFLKASPACASCHQIPHGEVREPLRRCERCHDAKSWRAVARLDFDHDRDTRYPLEKKHDGVACENCHAKRGNGAAQPPSIKSLKSDPPSKTSAGARRLTFRWPQWSFDCMPCHENVHGESLFGQKKCNLCHSAKVEFTRVNFDHNRRTRFPLDGAHADPKKAPCQACHKKDDRKKPDRACETCHADVHKDRFDKVSNRDCAVCHSANNFTTDLRFDHGARTKFPLTGAHQHADCRACHRGKGPTDYERLDGLVEKVAGTRRTQVACMGCHKHENVHQKQYTNDKCLDCHKMAGVVETKPRAINEFHGPQSRFPLTEGHRGVECARCHPNNVFTKTPLQCGPACHPDELHKGTLGTDCLKCHTGGRWEARLFDHDKDTKWPLVGNHKDVLCEGCHPRRDFANNRGKGVKCINCHQKDDVHGGKLGRDCEKCHEPTGRILFEHNDPTRSDWPLKGKHDGVRCADCHKSIQFKPTPRDCGGCHPEPGVHKGQLGTLCGSCHEEKGWSIIHTGHDVPTPRFGGAHDQVACVKCHPGGRLLAGTAKLCITCHRQDDVHHNVLGPNCGECHTQRTWAGARFEHSRVGCDLIGVHRLQPCVSCHVGGNFVALSTQCVSCHRKDAIAAQANPAAPMGHANFPTCSNCHNPNYFRPSQGMNAANKESVCR